MSRRADRQAIRARAKALLKENPKWRDKEVNAVLRREFAGKWLKAITLVVERTCAVEGKEQAFDTLTREGFSPFEANYLLSGLAVGIDSPAVLVARKERRIYYDFLRAKGVSHNRIMTIFDKRYRKPMASPFDFLDESYRVKGNRTRGRLSAAQYKLARTMREENRRRQDQVSLQKKADRAARFYRKLV